MMMRHRTTRVLATAMRKWKEGNAALQDRHRRLELAMLIVRPLLNYTRQRKLLLGWHSFVGHTQVLRQRGLAADVLSGMRTTAAKICQGIVRRMQHTQLSRGFNLWFDKAVRIPQQAATLRYTHLRMLRRSLLHLMHRKLTAGFRSLFEHMVARRLQLQSVAQLQARVFCLSICLPARLPAALPAFHTCQPEALAVVGLPQKLRVANAVRAVSFPA